MKKKSYAIPVKLPFKRIELRICATDGLGEMTKSFSSVQELAAFLKDHDAYATALGYVRRGQQ